MSGGEDTRGSVAPLQFVLLQGCQGFSKYHWRRLEGMRTIRRNPYKRAYLAWLPTLGGGLAVVLCGCFDKPDTTQCVKVTEATHLGVSFNSNREKGKHLH